MFDPKYIFEKSIYRRACLCSTSMKNLNARLKDRARWARFIDKQGENTSL